MGKSNARVAIEGLLACEAAALCEIEARYAVASIIDPPGTVAAAGVAGVVAVNVSQTVICSPFTVSYDA